MDDFIAEFTDEKIDYVRVGSDYFKIEGRLKGVDVSKAVAPGIFLGKEKNGKFSASLALLEILSKKTKKKAFIDDKAEWLFLCGRDVFEDSIRKMDAKEGLVLVQNLKDENLGMALISRKEKLMLKNVLDRGNFLRREKRNQ